MQNHFCVLKVSYRESDFHLECVFDLLFRYILLQFLILFQYLKSNVKFKTDTQVGK